MKNIRLLLEQSKTIKITDFEIEIKHNQEGFSIDIWRIDLIEPELLKSNQYWFDDLNDN